MPSKFKATEFDSPRLKYLSAYSAQVQMQVQQMIEQGNLAQYLLKKYPTPHKVSNDKALGLHTYVSRVQGNKLKSKHEIRIGSLFKKAPEAFLAMIVVHELAHLKEKEHKYS